ncbi:hypothetical protein QMK19_18265 [Streptomyces sp. H10-C2]|uniref:hypothetical protein n=1 Tax=unclassified Streptomyces TaxID=2593676 RepID=UPI0024BA14B4|nr:MULTISPECIES: hypothetical protein [unclassified Streptomyces]MDJ0343495.1 hypothetical protein [Streptomyces sp. PH10-H1]MDJ0371575.1 hypothetical protein [Streptomyces sp. H10-C2]
MTVGSGTGKGRLVVGMDGAGVSPAHWPTPPPTSPVRVHNGGIQDEYKSLYVETPVSDPNTLIAMH